MDKRRDSDRIDGMSLFGRTLLVRGEVRTGEDLTIEGRVEGPVLAEGAAIVLGPSASVTGDVIARDITVFGRIDGQLVATEIVDLRAGAEVTGQVVTQRLAINDGALFNGRVVPQQLEAALRVARYNQQKRDAAASGPARQTTPSVSPNDPRRY
jgi:cytoskeletal protein CcmA (bactofilin family)